ncbi:NAD(P)-binding protein [Massarina eburnea CBS 473.64]|uniref:NAD(P)-binding protein n=1 Tax=Massarina eburnea CBS 473.64 TaxID=1395130 RepID=A0A6A6RSW0_9PLEO|nr:NAD(P)-binding protein [Massarina eburnea CBS 473.64]
MARNQDRPFSAVQTLDGKTILITGATSGFGASCARILVTLHPARLILAVRSIERGEQFATELRTAHPNIIVDVWILDMLDYHSVQALAQRCTTLPRLDIAILNAGINAFEPKYSKSTGHEEILQVNYLSTALLSILLLPLLKSSKPGRLTISGSAIGLHPKFPERKITPQLVKADDVVVNNVDPGFSAMTGFSKDVPAAAKIVIGVLSAVMGRTAEQGAWTYVDAAVVKGKESHGSFIVNWENYPFHALMYTEEGKKVMEQLWGETIADTGGYGVGQALDDLSHA